MLELPAKRKPKANAATIDVLKIGDKVYSMRTQPDMRVGAQYLLDIAELGETQAGAKLFVSVVGKDALTALANYEGLEPEEFQQIISDVTTYVLGKLELSKN